MTPDDPDVTAVQCPYCGERVEVYVEPDVAGTFVQDCEICCSPWQVRVARTRAGGLRLQADRAE